MFQPLDGGCLCGAVRYRIAAAPRDSSYCHCRMCQKSSGAPAQASAEIPVEGFAVTKGEPTVYRSSAWGERLFCPACGSQLAFRLRADSKTVSVNTPTLDRPESIAPRMHIWCEGRAPWFEVADDLPRYERDGPAPSG